MTLSLTLKEIDIGHDLVNWGVLSLSFLCFNYDSELKFYNIFDSQSINQKLYSDVLSSYDTMFLNFSSISFALIGKISYKVDM